jgi:polysaccharide chain length determinant protein (PEP-CTERM system associated)
MQELVEQLLAIGRGMWQRRWIGLAVAWLAAIIGAIVVFRLPDKYEASARVYVDTQSLLQPLMAGMAITPDASGQVALLSRLLLTRPNIERIVRKSDLDTAAGRNAPDLVDETLSGLNINRAGGDNIYTIAFRYPDGRKARDVVQAALSIFIEQSLGRTRSGTDSARKFVDDQIKDYESKLRESEAKMQAFRLKYMGLLGTSGGGYIAQMGTLTEQIKDTHVELRVAEQTRDGIKKQLDEQTQRPDGSAPRRAVPTVSTPELDARINEQKRQLDDQLRKYTDQHPDVVATRRLITQLLEEKKREVEARMQAADNDPGSPYSGDPIAQQLKVALNDAEANVTAVRARLAEYESRYNQFKSSAESLPKIDMEYTQLDRDYGIMKRQYESLVSRRETASLTGKLEDAGVAEFRIIDPPRVTPNPVAPNRLLLLAAVVVVSLLAGLAVSWLVSQVRPTFHDGRSLRDIAQRPLIGMVSILQTHGLRSVRRRSALLFAGGLSGLFASYAAAFALLFFMARGV